MTPFDRETWTAVEGFVCDRLVPPDPALDGALAASDAAGLPPIAVDPPLGKMLMLLAMAAKARTVLEIGTLGGYSTIWLARALPATGELVTLERDARHAEVARANFAEAGLADMIDLRVGPALDTLAEMVREGEGPFDFVFVDADKASCADYLDWSLKLTAPGSVIVFDNVVREGRVIDAANDDPALVGIRALMDRLAAEPRVTATAIQTVGSKGYDGFALALVTDG